MDRAMKGVSPSRIATSRYCPFPVRARPRSAARIPTAAMRLPPPAPPIWTEGMGGRPVPSPSRCRMPARAEKFMSWATRSR